MGTLLNLTKEYFGDDERAETKITFNTKDMVPVDMGGSVYWADRELERLSGDTKHDKHFSCDEIENIKFEGGWRLPTMKEYFGLCYNKKIERFKDSNDKSITFSLDNTHSIKFKASGFYVGNMKGIIGTGGYGFDAAYLRLTSDISNTVTTTDDNGNTIILKFLYLADVSLQEKKPKAKWTHASSSWYYPVRLVKDKK